MGNRIFKQFMASIIAVSMITGSTFEARAEEPCDNQIIYEDASDEDVDENAPAVVYEDDAEDFEDTPEASVVYENEELEEYLLEDSVSENELEEDFFEDDTLSENEAEENTVSENEAEETVSENGMEETQIRHITADTEEAEDWFVELANEYVKDTDDRIIATYRLVYEDEGNLLFPVDATISTDIFTEGKNYYVLSEGYDNSLFYTNPKEITLEGMTVSLTDMVGNIAIIEEDGNIFEEQELEAELDGMVFKVSGEMPSGSTLSVGYLDDENYEKQIEEETGDAVVAAYDVSIKYDNGEKEYEPSEFGRTVEMTISGLDKIHEGSASVVHVTGEGVVERKTSEVDTVFSTNSVDFEMDSFSPIVVTATTALVVEERGVDISLLGETNHTIYHMSLTYGGKTKEAFCVDMGKSARSGKDYIQYGTFSNGNMKKILDVFYDDSINGSNELLTYTEAQALIWAFQKGYTSKANMTSVLTDVQKSVDGSANATRTANAINAIQNRTPANTYYAWKEEESPNDYQRFITLVGKNSDPAEYNPSGNPEHFWQIGDNAYAYIEISTEEINPDSRNPTNPPKLVINSPKVLHIVGYGDTWNLGYDEDGIEDVYVGGRGDPGALLGTPRQWMGNFEESVPYLSYDSSTDSYVKKYRTETYSYPDYICSIEVDPAITGFGNYFLDSYGLTKLNTFNIDWHTIQYVGDGSFTGFADLTGEISIDDLEYLGNECFCNTGISSLSVNGSYATICEYVFDDESVALGGDLLFEFNVANSVTKQQGSGYYDGVCNASDYGVAGNFTVKIGPDCRIVPERLFRDCTATVLDMENAESLEEIKDYAFSRMENITEITFPESLTTIGGYTVQDCENVTEMNYNAKNLVNYPTYMLRDTWNGMRFLNTSSYWSNPDGAKDLTFIIGENVETLPSYLLPFNTKTLNFNSEVVKIIPIGFASGLKRLTSVHFPAGNVIECIGDYAFRNCENLTDFGFDELTSLVAIGNGAFSKTPFTSVMLPDNVKALGSGVFAFCPDLTEFHTGTGLFSIGVMNFLADTSLTDIYLEAVSCSPDRSSASDNTRLLGNDYYYRYSEAVSSTCFLDDDNHYVYPVPNTTQFWPCFYRERFEPTLYGVVHGDYVSGTDVTIHIGPEVEKIGDALFNYDDCKTIDFSTADSLTTIGDHAFLGSMISGDLVIPEGVTYIGKYCFCGYEPYSPNDSGGNQYETYIGALEQNIESITIPSTVTEIGTNAFDNRTGVRSVEYNAVSVNYEKTHDNNNKSFNGPPLGYFIGWDADSCVLEIGDDVEYIPNNLFELCGFTSIEWNSPTKMTVIRPYLFHSNIKLETLVIPENIETIYWGAFESCFALNDITIPDSVTTFYTGGETYEVYDGYDPETYDPIWKTMYSQRTFGLKYASHVDNMADIRGKRAAINATFDVDTDGDEENDMLRTTVNTTNPLAITHDWAGDLRYVEGLSTAVTVDFNTHGADTPTPDSQELEIGDKVEKPDDPEKRGYEFAGWWTAENGELGTGDEWNFDTDTVESNMTLHAWWKKPVTVTYDKNGAKGTTPQPYHGYAGEVIDLPDEGDMVKEGYFFKGWAYRPTDTTPTAGVDTFTVPDSDITLYACWVKGYTLTYSDYGKTDGEPPEPVVLDPDNPKTRVEDQNTLEKTAYRFEGWSSIRDAAVVEDSPGDEITLTGDKTLYPVWTEHYDYQITIPASISLRYDDDLSGEDDMVYTCDFPVDVSVTSLPKALDISLTETSDSLHDEDSHDMGYEMSSDDMTVAGNRKSASTRINALFEGDREYEMSLRGEPSHQGFYSGGTITVTATHG